MNEREALFRAVCENPDDDTPRLVFADWLQENGEDAHAEFIRAQIEQLQLPPHTIPWYKCQTRIRKCLASHEAKWRAQVPVDAAWHYPEFQRGFLEKLYVTDFEVFRQHAEAIFAATPLRQLFLRRSCNLAALSQIPHLNRLSVVEGVAMDATPSDVRQLIAALPSPRLTRFHLIHGVLDEEALQLLVEHFGSVVNFPIV